MSPRPWLIAAPLLLCACQSAPSEPVGTVVVGITSDFAPGVDIHSLVAVTSLDGASAIQTRWSLDGPTPLTFPIELPFADLPHGARIDVALAAFEAEAEGHTPFLTRQLATSIAAGHDLLYRAHLGWECVPSFQLAGGALAPTCEAPRTCVAAACEDPYRPPDHLEPYSPSWAVAFADECRPLHAEAPEVVIGEGLDAYHAVAPAGAVAMQAGNQGGYHLWLGARMKNLHRVGSTTVISAQREATAAELCNVKVPWDYAPSLAGHCDLVGVRCVVANGFDDPDLEGALVRLRVQVVDVSGDVAVHEQDITLAAPQ